MSKWPGDWNCRSCQHYNFSWRDSCQQCGDGRMPSSSAGFVDLSIYAAGLGGSCEGSSLHSSGDPTDVAVRPGDWYCSSCGGHNFASRSSCHLCGSFSVVGWKSGDWLCTRSGCNQHNFASRRECYRCKAPKGCGT